MLRPVRERVASDGFFALPSPGGGFHHTPNYFYFTFRKLMYIWHAAEQRFLRVPALDDHVPVSNYYEWADGLSKAQVRLISISYQ